MSDTDPKDAPKEEPKDDPTPDPAKEPDLSTEVEKWKALARKHEARAKENDKAAQKLAEQEDAKKSDLQKATDKVTAAEQRAADAERKALQIEVALEKAPDGMALSQVRKLAKRLAGGSREEFEADAEDLFADFTPDTGDQDEPKKGRPKERLKPGAAPKAEPEDNDPKALADAVPRGW